MARSSSFALTGIVHWGCILWDAVYRNANSCNADGFENIFSPAFLFHLVVVIASNFPRKSEGGGGRKEESQSSK